MDVPLVLLHPFPLDGTFWDPVAARLAAGRAVHVPRFPGFGGAPVHEDPSIAGFADSVADRIGAQAPHGRAVVCGVSMGAYVAQALAARHPGQVAGLILSGTRADADAPDARDARLEHARALDAGRRDEFLQGLVPRLVPAHDAAALGRADAIAHRQPAAAMAAAMRAMAARPDRSGELAAMDVPALVLRGDADAVIPADAARSLADGLPQGRLHVVEGAGHLVPLERPDLCVELATALVGEVDSAA